jgi:hypothetical protein
MIRIERNPTHRQLTVFGWLWLAFFGVLGGTTWWQTGSLGTAAVLWAIGATIPAAGLLWPGVPRIVFVLASYATFPIGFVLSYAILAVVYYMVLTPTGLVLRLRGYDPMKRRFDHDAESYWTPREPQDVAERYFRQF